MTKNKHRLGGERPAPSQACLCAVPATAPATAPVPIPESTPAPASGGRAQGGHVGRRQERAAAEVYEGKLASVDPRHRGRPASSPAGHSAVRLRRSVRFRRGVPFTGRVGRPCRWD